jgi:hypothetical protein
MTGWAQGVRCLAHAPLLEQLLTGWCLLSSHHEEALHRVDAARALHCLEITHRAVRFAGEVHPSRLGGHPVWHYACHHIMS